ncbi:S1 RNA-binding domain-containing protein [Streptomyces sp. NPDC057253]|uniref:S1 RNA-binding domain-containing protein n=1 Tax=Streptomyces sp. NPDC057253 TaxID=3346069 RepID=UPI00362A3CEE
MRNSVLVPRDHCLARRRRRRERGCGGAGTARTVTKLVSFGDEVAVVVTEIDRERRRLVLSRRRASSERQ